VKRLLIGLLLMSLVFGITACSTGEPGGTSQDEPEEPIKIGVIGPMTGDWAYEGGGFQNAVNLIIDMANEDGGAMGRQFEVVVGDTKGKPNDAALAAQKMVDQGVVAVVGSYASSSTEPASEVLNEANILHVTPSSTASHLTEKGFTQFFRTCFLDNAQGDFAATFMIESLGAEKIALIHDNTTYAKGLADWTQRYVEELGGEVVFFEAITPGAKDFSAVLAKVKQRQPDAIYFTGYFSDGGLLLKQARDLGIAAEFVAGNACNNPEFIKLAGSAAEGAYVTSEPLPVDLLSEAAVNFVARYEEAYGEKPGSIWTVLAAEAAKVIVEAVKATESTDTDTLAQHLRDLEGYEGITGPVSFDEKGDRLGTMHKAYTVVDGEFQMVTAK